MSNFDEYLKNKAKEAEIDVPDSVKNQIEQVLSELPENGTEKKRIRIFPKFAAIAACFIFVTLFLMPNISIVYAQSLERIPVIRDIVRVITIRNYFYSDDYHEMNIDVPKIEDENSEASDFINKSVSELTDMLVSRFYYDLETIGDNGHGSVYLDYETITNTDKWFTIKIRVHEAVGSSNTYFKYYHINKLTGKIICLGDMAKTDDFYEVLNKDIRKQMDEEMAKDSDVFYWTESSVMGMDFVSLNAEHNFYWNENGDIVIPFDKYEIAPGSMGTPEFTVKKAVFKNEIKDEFIGIFN